MTKPPRYTVTAALPYANGALHLGHIAGAYLPADIYVRYLRLRQADVAFICGSDEHGAAITLRAVMEGILPREIIDKYHALNKQAFRDFGIDFDIFHRTSSELHYRTASDYFKKLYEKDVFDELETEQFYDQEHHQFLADRYVTGTCPNCRYENAFGDQCEKCGSSLSPTDLIGPKSVLSGKTPVLKKTKHWYLPLNKYEDWLREWIVEGKGQTEAWKKNVYGQCKSWIDAGLQPRAITRDLNWGVPVPLQEGKGKVLYVWLDAPIGYISATKQWAIDRAGQNPDVFSKADWKKYWTKQPDPADNARLIHFIGKDNIVFHCIIFPILLRAHGDFILPANVPANEFMNLEGDKMSTSRNWVVQLHEYLENFAGKQDVLRYVLCSNMPETKDSEFTWKDYQDKNNNELVAVLGNYINRVVVLTHKYFDGKVPETGAASALPALQELTAAIAKSKAAVERALESYRFREALNEMMGLARAGNKHLADMEPWKLIKTDEAAVQAILGRHLQVIANLAILMRPFLPFTSDKVRQFLHLEAQALAWANIGRIDLLPTGRQLDRPELLFEKVADETVAAQIGQLKKNREAAAAGTDEPAQDYPPIKPAITYEDFAKLDMRSGTILKAEQIKKADKLLKLTVSIGSAQRTIVAGIAKQYEPEKLAGQKVIVLVNLQPCQLRGIESQGMILMSETAEGELAFLQPSFEVGDGGVVS